MNELVTKWDWIAVGICIGFAVDRTIGILKGFTDVILKHMDLRLNLEMQKVINNLEAELQKMRAEK